MKSPFAVKAYEAWQQIYFYVLCDESKFIQREKRMILISLRVLTPHHDVKKTYHKTKQNLTQVFLKAQSANSSPVIVSGITNSTFEKPTFLQKGRVKVIRGSIMLVVYPVLLIL